MWYAEAMARALLYAAVLGAAGSSFAACGGATTSDIVDGPGGSSGAGSSSGSSSGGSSSSGGGSSASSSGASGSSSSGGSSGVTPGKCTDESEPNNSQERANPIGVAFCGTLATGDDVDWATFVLPKTSTGFSFNFTVSKPQAQGFIHVKGETVPLDGKVPYYNGETYSIEVRGKNSGGGNAAGTTYRVDVNIK